MTSTDAAAGSVEGYTRTAIALHWIMLGGIICAYALGWIMTDMAISPRKLQLFNWHKWLGVTILGLGVLRAGWRATHRPPDPLPMPAWQRQSALVVHVLLYFLLFAMPLSGWAYSNAAGYPIVYLGVWPLPDLVHKDKELAETLEKVHSVGGWVLLVAIALHAAAAFKHHFVDRDATLTRMLRSRP